VHLKNDCWLLKLNIKKCNVLSLSYSRPNTIIKYKYSASVDNMIIDLERCNKVRRLEHLPSHVTFYV